MISPRFSRWIGAGLAALMVMLVPVSAFADDGGGGGGFRGHGRTGFQQSSLCAKLDAAIQTVPDLAYYSGVQGLLGRCGLPVQPATTQPVCSGLLQAVGQAGILHRYPGVMRELRNCLLPQGSSQPQGSGLLQGPNPLQGSSQPQGAPLQLSSQFNDLGGWGWALKDIEILESMGIVGGVAPHRYAPAGKLTRAQFAALMKRVFNLPVPSSPSAFVDVQPGTWYYNDVEAAAPYMSSFDTPGGVAFEPGIDVTRIEVAATIGKVLVQENQATLPSPSQAESTFSQFTDGSQVPSGMAQYAAIAVTKGLMIGLPNGSFGVESALDRAQAAVLLVRVLRTSETMNGVVPGTSSTYSVSGTFTTVNGQQVIVSTTGGSVTLSLASSYSVTLNGQPSSLGALQNGDAVTLTVDTLSDQVTAIAATNNVATTYTVSGTLGSIVGQQLNVSTATGSLVLDLAPSYTVTLNGQPSSLGALQNGDGVTLTVESATSEVTAIAATGTTTSTYTVSGTLSSIVGQQLNVSTATGTETLTLAPSYTVTLNGQPSSLGTLQNGDAVTLTVESATSEVTAIAATGTTTSTYTVSGTLSSIVGQQLNVSTATGTETLTLAPSYTVTLNGEPSSLEALQNGDAVTLTVESATSEVTAIAATGTTTSTYTVSGTLSSIVGQQLNVSTATGTETLTLAPSYTVTLNGQPSSLGALQNGDAVTLTVESATSEVTAIAATAAVTQTVTGYIVAEPSTVSLSVYGTGGLQSYSLATGAAVTLDGQSQSSIASVPLGDQASISLDAQNVGTQVSATTPSPAPVTGAYEGLSGSTISVEVGGNLETIAAGASPVAYVNGSVVGLTPSSIANGTSVTIDPSGPGGSALVIVG